MYIATSYNGAGSIIQWHTPQSSLNPQLDP